MLRQGRQFKVTESPAGLRLAVLLGAVLVLCLVLVGVVYARYSRSSPRASQQQLRADSPGISTPTNIGALLEPSELQHSIGDIVFLKDVQFERGPSENVFFAVDRAGHRILIVSERLDAKKGAGQLVDVTGTIAGLPSRATIRKQWKLNKDEAQTISKQQVYIRADRVRIAVQSARERQGD
jgi:hypothetical protein